ncbi:MAG: tRNA pseudouridine(55) synthase TruB [Dehalococcoidia bacterium]|nr:tRNA pseudouridine(55) synthase TruB [Dehalococcoidia bacterium]
MRGFLNIDKPVGITSFDVVRAIRRASRVKRVGHAGTLDPLASGVLPVAVGDATRLIDALVNARKTYRAEVTLGIETTTDDAEGEPTTLVPPETVAALSTEAIEQALATFLGETMQTPPAFSAIKRDGQPAYRAARRGEPLELAARPATAHALRLIARDGSRCVIEVECAKGYYVRALARDLGRVLGVGGHITALRRTQVGPFRAERAIPLALAVARLEAGEVEGLLHAPDAVLVGWPVILLDDAALSDVRIGRVVHPEPRVEAPPEPGILARAYASDGVLAAITEHRGGWEWQPVRVFATENAQPSSPRPV